MLGFLGDLVSLGEGVKPSWTLSLLLMMMDVMMKEQPFGGVVAHSPLMTSHP
jgi:hypothetical protein